MASNEECSRPYNQAAYNCWPAPQVPIFMYIYLPIAEVSMHIAIVIGLGGGIGFLSGMFGVGGGFLMTPMLIFLGVPGSKCVIHVGCQKIKFYIFI